MLRSVNPAKLPRPLLSRSGTSTLWGKGVSAASLPRGQGCPGSAHLVFSTAP